MKKQEQDPEATALERGRRWAQYLTRGTVSPDEVERIAAAYARNNTQPLVYRADYADTKIWRFGNTAIVRPHLGLPQWFDGVSTEGTLLSDEEIIAYSSSAFNEPDLADIYLTSFSSKWQRAAKELRRMEIEIAFHEAGVPFHSRSGGRKRDVGYAFHVVPSYWLQHIGLVLKDFRNSLPPEVVSTCFAVKAYNLLAVRWLLAAPNSTAIRYRCQALRVQPYWFYSLIRDQRKSAQKLALCNAIDTGKSWLEPFAQALCAFAPVDKEAEGKLKEMLRSLAFMHGRRCAPNWLDAHTHKLERNAITTAFQLSGPRQPIHKKDWIHINQICLALNRRFNEATLYGCPVSLSDPWYANIDPQLIQDTRERMLNACQTSDTVWDWLCGLGRAEGGSGFHGQRLSQTQIQAGLVAITLRQWLKLSKIYHGLRPRAIQVVDQHPVKAKRTEDDMQKTWLTPESFTAHNGYRIEWLNSMEALQEEGATMAHCVGDTGYATACLLGESRIVSIRDTKGNRTATAEIVFPKDEQKPPVLRQIYGKLDSSPTPKSRSAAQEALAQVKKIQRPVAIMDKATLINRLYNTNDTTILNHEAVDDWLTNVLWREARRHPTVETAIQQAVSVNPQALDAQGFSPTGSSSTGSSKSLWNSGTFSELSYNKPISFS